MSKVIAYCQCEFASKDVSLWEGILKLCRYPLRGQTHGLEEERAVTGAGAVVISDVSAAATVVGNPARVL